MAELPNELGRIWQKYILILVQCEWNCKIWEFFSQTPDSLPIYTYIKSMAGRPPNKILTSNFQRLEKKDNQSNRYIWECNHCPSGATGARIEGRDNRPFLHLIDPIACPNAPSEVRHEARLLLMDKGLLQTDSGPILSPLPSSASSHNSESSLDAASDAGCVMPIKKRKGGKLDQYIIPVLTREQEAEANVKFFRYVCRFGIRVKIVN
jgi:hypothetical protein